jgi:uncharacterized protein
LSSPDNPQFETQTPPGPVPPSLLPGVDASLAPPPFISVPVIPVPAEDPAWSGWDVLALAVLTFVAVGALQLAMAFAAQRLWYPHETIVEVIQRPTVALIAQFLIYIPVAALMVVLVKVKDDAPFWRAIRWNWPSSAWKWLALGVVMLMGLAALQSILPMPKDTPFEHLFDNALDAYLLSILAVSIGPLMEELFFRGFMYPVLARRMGAVWGVLLTALPFGLLHLQQYGWAWGAGLVIFLVGVVCGVVRAATKSVGAAFLVHVGYNGMQMAIAIAYTRGFTHIPKAVGMFGR